MEQWPPPYVGASSTSRFLTRSRPNPSCDGMRASILMPEGRVSNTNPMGRCLLRALANPHHFVARPIAARSVCVRLSEARRLHLVCRLPCPALRTAEAEQITRRHAVRSGLPRHRNDRHLL